MKNFILYESFDQSVGAQETVVSNPNGQKL